MSGARNDGVLTIQLPATVDGKPAMLTLEYLPLGSLIGTGELCVRSIDFTVTSEDDRDGE